uniref:THD domain-containing protein n=1 Tax=Neogobius melanostomus TaxID=47308 RepID=A0A8C6WQB7_9GOBI
MTRECVMYISVPPPQPPRSGRRRPIGSTPVLLFVLVTVALCGMVLACFIYPFYNPPAAQVSVQYIVMKSPLKPVAHLTDGTDLTHGKQVMAWSELADPLLYKVAYKNGSLVFKENGYYYIYSKVSFRADHGWYHSIELKTKYYLGKNDLMLLLAKPSSKQSNSFLAGVFHFYKDDAIFVKVSDTSHVARGDPTQNVFGAYLI